MKKYIFIAFVFCCYSLSAQVPVDSAFHLLKKEHVLAPTADWNNIERSFYSALDSAQNDIDSVKCIRLVLEMLDDPHSQIIYKQKIFNHFRMYSDSLTEAWRPVVQRSHAATNHPFTKLLNDTTVYVLVPGMNAQGEDIRNLAIALADSIDQYKLFNVKHFVLDFRLNAGGQAISMLAGLSRIYGDGLLGYSVDYYNEVQRTIELKAGNLFMNDIPLTKIDFSKYKDFSKVPVSVIIGPVTMSSGSISAAFFRGRENTRIIGENTAAGYTTGNQFYVLGTTLFLNLSVEYTRDRKGNIYRDSVNPDVKISGVDNFDFLQLDEKVLFSLSKF